MEAPRPAAGDAWALAADLLAVLPPDAADPTAAVAAILQQDWATALWLLLEIAVADPAFAANPRGWDDLAARLRRLALQTDALAPYILLSRLVFTLQAAAQNLNAPGVSPELRQLDPERLAALVAALRVEALPAWRQEEPEPPFSTLAYTELDAPLAELAEMLPDAHAALSRALDQPRAQVKLALEAWSRKEFDLARRALGRLLLWDPDRRRLLLAAQALETAPIWLEAVRQGPAPGEALEDFAARLELAGRELRQRVGPARWLDLILDAFARLRKGARPAELLMERPELLNEAAWLHFHEPRVAAVLTPPQPVRLEREVYLPPAVPQQLPAEGRLGPEGDLTLTEPLDTWVPEARGSSARVFNGFLRGPNGTLSQAAIKIMRPDKRDYALPLFLEEVQILALMADVPGVTPMLEVGYLRLDGEQTLPGETTALTARGLTGALRRHGIGDVPRFLRLLPELTAAGWLPYLATEKRSRDENLLLLCDPGVTHGRFLPVAESLRLAIQMCDLLAAAHERNIVYRDHKILHYYWVEAYNGVFVIDWNVAKLHPAGLPKSEKEFDLVQLGARALHPLFTGRAAPGALPLGPTRPDEIEAASHTYRPQWTYDDQRLPGGVKDLLEAVLAGRYAAVADLRADLLDAFGRANPTA
jgi:hypothetical protein